MKHSETRGCPHYSTVALTFAAILFLTIFAAQNVVAQNYRKYASPNYGWSVTFPAAWVLDRSDPALVAIRSPSRAALCGIQSAQVRFESVDAFADFMVDYPAQLARAQGLQPKFVALTRRRITLSSGQDAVDSLVAIGGGGKSHRIYALVDTIGLVIDCETAEQNWSRFEKLFDAIIVSFSIGNAGTNGSRSVN